MSKYDEFGREIDEDGVLKYWKDYTDEEKNDILSDEYYDRDR